MSFTSFANTATRSIFRTMLILKACRGAKIVHSPTKRLHGRLNYARAYSIILMITTRVRNTLSHLPVQFHYLHEQASSFAPSPGQTASKTCLLGRCVRQK